MSAKSVPVAAIEGIQALNIAALLRYKWASEIRMRMRVRIMEITGASPV